jgi:hypothetical protein
MPVWGIIVVIIGALICCGLCAYWIATAVRGSKERRDPAVHARGGLAKG